ncbi:DNA topoisomerase 1 [Thelohanellus kitauei]|uniref:DNA topoisomerase n=1 Tax=Thelohanellus kitauei TaxID=669202 RepID=A0A0C2JUJ6_THEKT|nr:DNA topoisomerase 1 [Thelohanellus kitauei]
MKNKKPQDDLFDKLSTTSLNKFLGQLMPGLTAKVFRTYNASTTLQKQLKELTVDTDDIHNKLLSYNRANRSVAVLCNHQRAIPKTFEKSMENLNEKIKSKKEEFKNLRNTIIQLKSDNAPQQKIESMKNKFKKLKESLRKLKISVTDKEENKQIALGTSKLNYLDPRISVGWCLRTGVPIEKIYNKTQRDKFQWAIDMADQDFEF